MSRAGEELITDDKVRGTHLPPMSAPSQTGRDARVAGLWYLLLAIAGIFSLRYVPTLIVQGNAVATAANFLSKEELVRVGIAGELVEAVLSIFLVRALYRLLAGVDRVRASLMVTLVLVAVPIAFIVVLSEIAALFLFNGAGLVPAFSAPQLDALGMMFLNLHSQGLYVVSVFWGLWLFPFGLLVYRSGFLPRLLGVLLVVNGFAYLGISAASLLFPAYSGHVSQVLALPEALGELSTMIWLLAKGANPPGAEGRVAGASS
jgi:hypothetical protein